MENNKYQIKDCLQNFKIKVRLKQINSTISENDDTHEDVLTLKWQEKYYSKFDNEEIQQVGSNPSYSRLFTYLDKDLNPDHYHLYSSTKCQSSTLNPINERPSLNERTEHRFPLSSIQCMYIMADLRHSSNVTQQDEHLLCTITVDDDRMMSISHQLLHWHRVQSNDRDIYEYCIEHISRPINNDELKKEKQLHYEMYHHQTNLHKQLVGDTFQSAPEGKDLRVLLLVSIISAQGFDSDNIYIDASLQVPKGWLVEDGTDQVTQISSYQQIAHFCCPVEYLLLKQEMTDINPCIQLEIYSLDKWDRHCTEGYVIVNVPPTPGIHKLTVPTYRPTPLRLIDQLRQYFIGGSVEIQSFPHLTIEDKYSHYGSQTVSSGSVTLQLNILHQSQQVAEVYHDQHTLRQRKGLSSSVKAVSDAYRRAHLNALELMKTEPTK